MESSNQPAADFGPMPPPNMVNGTKVENVEESALKGSIKKKG